MDVSGDIPGGRGLTRENKRVRDELGLVLGNFACVMRGIGSNDIMDNELEIKQLTKTKILILFFEIWGGGFSSPPKCLNRPTFF